MANRRFSSCTAASARAATPISKSTRLLTLHGSEHVAPLLGWIEAQWSDVDGVNKRGHLGMLQAFLRTATDGWDIALSSVRDLLVEEDLHPDEVGGDFASEAERLGAATAEVHLDLASLLETAIVDIGSDGRIGCCHDSSARSGDRGGAGDRTPMPGLFARTSTRSARWHRPCMSSASTATCTSARPCAPSRAGRSSTSRVNPRNRWPSGSLWSSPFRDVAGMLRSFDYAAAVTLRQFGEADHLLYHADEWTARNREAFLEGYASIGADDDPAIELLLRAYEADKAVYEAVYEARNRPAWVPIPVRAIARIAADKETS
ncbi:MAG: hypothetical protein WKF82_09160 [Nocardioidaceae bacterium]